MDPPKRYLSEKDVAAITGFSRYTFQRLRFEHKGPNYLKIGRSIRYLPEDIAAWMEERHIKINPDH